MSLQSVPLASVVLDARSGFASGDDLDQGIFQIRMNNITRDGSFDLRKRRRVRVQGRNTDSLFLQLGDVLFNATNSPDLVGKSAFVTNLDEPTTFSNHFLRLRTHLQKLEGGYLTHWLHTQFQAGKFKGLCRQWVNQATVSRDALLSMEIPLPTLPEQRRITAILDQANALRAKRRAALAQLDIFTQSIFIEIFGDPVVNSKGWQEIHLDSICTGIWDIDHNMPKAVENGIPFISAKDLVGDGKICFDAVKMISEDDFRHLSRKGVPQKGDIIYSRIGVALGKARLVSVDFPFLASYSCCTIRPDVSKVDREYLCHLLDSPSMLKQAHKGVRAIAVPDLGMGEIKNWFQNEDCGC